MTYPRWAALIGGVALLLAGPNLLASTMPEPADQPLMMGYESTDPDSSVDMGLRCQLEDMGMYQNYDCGDTIVQTLMTSSLPQDPDKAMRRMQRALSIESAGPMRWTHGLLTQNVVADGVTGKAVKGVAVAVFREDSMWLWVSFGTQATMYASYAAGILGDDSVPDGHLPQVLIDAGAHSEAAIAQQAEQPQPGDAPAAPEQPPLAPAPTLPDPETGRLGDGELEDGNGEQAPELEEPELPLPEVPIPVPVPN
ncbi:hypothetical protein [Corynebacterium aquilae]|uniref:hypothetical protein n=1 Tax=Corynebacterium aquilae TaxID=203263 RepID=UPI0012EE43FC|nr:hypothetical protein [Corynebacterium aquilae]